MKDFNELQKELLLQYVKTMQNHIKKLKRSIKTHATFASLICLLSIIANVNIALIFVLASLWTSIIISEVIIVKNKERRIENIINMNGWLFKEQEEEYEIVKVYDEPLYKEEDTKPQRQVISPINHQDYDSKHKTLTRNKDN